MRTAGAWRTRPEHLLTLVSLDQRLPSHSPEEPQLHMDPENLKNITTEFLTSDMLHFNIRSTAGRSNGQSNGHSVPST